MGVGHPNRWSLMMLLAEFCLKILFAQEILMHRFVECTMPAGQPRPSAVKQSAVISEKQTADMNNRQLPLTLLKNLRRKPIKIVGGAISQ